MNRENGINKNNAKGAEPAVGMETPKKSSPFLNGADWSRRFSFDDVLSYSPRFENSNKPVNKGRVSSSDKKKSSARKSGKTKPVYYGSDGANHSKPTPKRQKKKALRTFPPAQSKKTTGGEAKTEANYKAVSRKRNIAGLKRTLTIFILLLLAAAGIYGLYRLTIVNEIIVNGSEKYESSLIVDRCGIQTGHNIFTYRFADIEEKLNIIPELKLISIKRRLPDKIEFAVADRFPRAAVPSGNGTYTVIDSEGFVISIGGRNAEGLILINGLIAESFKPGRHINREANLSLRSAAAIELIKAIDEGGMQDSITGIDVSNISCVKLFLKYDFTAVLGTYPEALDNMETTKKAYDILLERYPEGGVINVFSNKTTVDFTPNT